jgi:hypothetical protein
MSYGEWRKNGKGWATLEIDSPWNATLNDLQYYEDAKYRAVCSLIDRNGGSSTWRGSDNVAAIRFEIRHEAKGRQVIGWNVGGGEHTTWFAFDSIEALKVAMLKNYVKDGDEDWNGILNLAERKAA